MGQEEVYLLLKRNKNKWLSAREIIDKLKKSPGSVITSLQKLRKSELISFKFGIRPTSSIGKRNIYVYKFK